MENKRNISIGFAIFATILILTTPLMARPIQEKTTDVTEKDECSLCTKEIPVDLSVIQKEIENLQEHNLISDKTASKITGMIHTTDPNENYCNMIWFILHIFDQIYSENHNFPPTWLLDLATWYDENCE